MKSTAIRNNFIQFFKQKGHSYCAPAPIVQLTDPSLLFVNAGMNQFKEYFLAAQSPTYPRVTNTQPCLRVAGKHNDLEEVGVDLYHHTLFEMLGNWSFGDYFKNEAIQWAWELLTAVYHLPKERLYVTIFEGDKILPKDYEAAKVWERYIDKSHIILGNKQDNFWEMGTIGPCGPASEIHIDIRSEEERQQQDGSNLVNTGHPQVIEIWNLVFIQYNRLTTGKLAILPQQHIDTGMGLERLAMVLQGKKSTYDTDIFILLIAKIVHIASKPYGKDQQTDIAIRVIVDHIRAIVFAMADGQLPSNQKAGYVLRRLLRRAVRYGYTALGLTSPFLYQLVTVLADQFKTQFPHIYTQQTFITEIIQKEESAFFYTLAIGLQRFDQIVHANTTSHNKTIAGGFVFELYDTYGFPPDLTALLAKEKALQIDQQGFDQAMKIQQQRSQKKIVQNGDWHIVHNGLMSTFVGYEQSIATTRLIQYRVVGPKNDVYQLVFETTPFYAEGGGQVGDIGYIEAEGKKIAIVDTKRDNGLILHYTNQLPENLDTVFSIYVDSQHRLLSSNNHTATHLLQAALRKVLGKHVIQRGSLVNDQLLRFDFTHYQKITQEEIITLEAIVNQQIRANTTLKIIQNMPLEKAKEMGTQALFNEKYGKYVRVVICNQDFSVELCGGIHAKATGQLGLFKIITTFSIAAGVRRIEAVTADAAEAYIQKTVTELASITKMLKHPNNTVFALEQLIQKNTKQQEQIQYYQKEILNHTEAALKKKIQQYKNMQILVEKISLPNVAALRTLCFDLKNQYIDLGMVLAVNIAQKPYIAVVFGKNILPNIQIDAQILVKELASLIQGSGGGQPFFALAGGKDNTKLDTVVDKARYRLMEILK